MRLVNQLDIIIMVNEAKLTQHRRNTIFPAGVNHVFSTSFFHTAVNQSYVHIHIKAKQPVPQRLAGNAGIGFPLRSRLRGKPGGLHINFRSMRFPVKSIMMNAENKIQLALLANTPNKLLTIRPL